MDMDIWQSKENPNEFFGTNKDLVAFNKAKGGSLLVENQQAFDIFSKGSPLVVPSTSPVGNEMITNPATKKKKKAKKEKIINVAAIKDGREINISVRQSAKVAPMPMPRAVIEKNQIGYSSPSMIRGVEEDAMEKMRKCLTKEEREKVDTAEETGNPILPTKDKEEK